MSDTPTPRTDEQDGYMGEGAVDSDFARELERGNAALRGRMARLCRAVSRRMQAEDPTPEDRIELMEAYDAACALLALATC